ncbi:hypothetical protein J7413_02440 [Shimia sp. R10_1]|uniref:hypothetical protein n=1 Tax=Shimia sp. R10_1 TaxID=2821095 RepID=UPI001AD9E25F|nr:hypothetical protein [Shimia sp. R10_1]MBO9472385.1 hypothetical protein [Shimia sp. R10_1]
MTLSKANARRLLSNALANLASITMFAGVSLAASNHGENSGQTNELPQVFSVDCSWSETTSTFEIDKTGALVTRAFSSANAPQKVLLKSHLGWVELAGMGGERHFVMPSTGSLLGGQMLTVMMDGRATRTQTTMFKDEIRVSAEIGHCEVIE